MLVNALLQLLDSLISNLPVSDQDLRGQLAPKSRETSGIVGRLE